MVVLEIILAIAAVFGVIRLVAGPQDKPSEFDRDIWCADPEERAKRLKVVTAAWKAARKAGKPFANPYTLQRIEAECEAAKSRPWTPQELKPAPREEPPRRLVRRHPMRPATWE